MSLVTLPTTFVDNTIPTASQFNGDFTAITAVLNGGLENDNISATAAIEKSKISGGSAGFLTSKVGVFTRDTSAADGDVAITGVGFKPTALIVFGASQAGSQAISWGVADSTGAEQAIDTVPTGNANSQTNVLIRIATTGTSDLAYARLTSFDTDGFTIGWTKVGSPTATAALVYIAFK